MTRASRGSRARRLRHVAGALFVLISVAVPGLGQAGSHTQEELNRAKERLETLRKDHRAAQGRMNDIRAQIDSLTNQISQVTMHIEALRTAIDEAKASIHRSKRQTQRLQAALDERAREVYIRGPAGALELVLEAESLNDLSDRFNFLDVLSRNDADLAEGLSVERQLLNDSRRNFRTYETELLAVQQQLVGKQGELEALFAEQQAAAAELEDAVAEQEKIVKDLEKKLQRELLAQYGIQGGGTSGPPVGADGPLYWCPVDPPRSYVDTFGAPRPGGRTHQGNDIFAPEGTPIRAPFAGIAEESFNSLGGYTVSVFSSANDDDVYNAHMSRYAGVDGQQVQPGDIIGFVGTSGNAVGTPPHNHFEYHPGGGSAVSPYLYLNEVCGLNGGG
jgi:peptidoglycan hydrolase CwlO-like protein